MQEGGCQCGAVRYRIDDDKMLYHALCHCADCRASSGAPATAWLAVQDDAFVITRGEATAFNSSGQSVRHFCARCGTGLYFVNPEMLPGIVDVQSATLDDPPAPTAQIQVAERLEYMAHLSDLPEFDRYPGP